MNRQQAVQVSISLQELASVVNDFLEARAGETVAFVLMVATDGVTQYVSNASRADGTAMVESLLARWKAGRADIPAHMNPDLKPPTA
jgi:hypothetical protein